MEHGLININISYISCLQSSARDCCVATSKRMKNKQLLHCCFYYSRCILVILRSSFNFLVDVTLFLHSLFAWLLFIFLRFNLCSCHLMRVWNVRSEIYDSFDDDDKFFRQRLDEFCRYLLMVRSNVTSIFKKNFRLSFWIVIENLSLKA